MTNETNTEAPDLNTLLDLAYQGLRDWETPENRYRALRAIDAFRANMRSDLAPPAGVSAEQIMRDALLNIRDYRRDVDDTIAAHSMRLYAEVALIDSSPTDSHATTTSAVDSGEALTRERAIRIATASGAKHYSTRSGVEGIEFEGNSFARFIKSIRALPPSEGSEPEIKSWKERVKAGASLSDIMTAAQEEIDERTECNRQDASRAAGMTGEILRLKGLILKVIDTWWPFVHGNTGASRRATDLLEELREGVKSMPTNDSMNGGGQVHREVKE